MSLFRKHSQNTAQRDPHDWVLPTSFHSWPGKKQSETIIPSKSIFRDVSLTVATSSIQNRSPATSYPTPGHIAVHLCLLECFHKLAKEAANVDGMNSLQHSAGGEDCRSILTRLAIDRFIAWHEKIESILERAAFYGKSGVRNAVSNFTKDYLPPLDVLYVWSAYMTQPEVYQRHCPKLPCLCMPWDSILEVIDLDAFSYEIPTVAKQLFRTITNQSSDIVEYLKSPPVYRQASSQDFILDLMEAVQAQDRFVSEMHTYLWIRSPAIAGTLSRALTRYYTIAKRQSHISPILSQDDPAIELICKTHLMYAQAFESQTKYDMTPVKMESDLKADCYCWTCERIRDENPTYVHGEPLDISKEQIVSIVEDVGFHRHVQDFRTLHPPGTPLPTRQMTTQEIERRKLDKQKKDEAGVYYGLGYVVTETRPAVYDAEGKMLKPAKVKVRRDNATKGINSMMGGGFA